MLSLTGGGEPLPGSGVARLLGDLTFLSEDSLVRGSSTTELVGIDNEVGSGLQLPAGAFLDASGLLGQGCVARRAGKGSTIGREGKGGLPPSPDRPLASSGTARVALRAGDVLRVASAGCEARVES